MRVGIIVIVCCIACGDDDGGVDASLDSAARDTSVDVPGEDAPADDTMTDAGPREGRDARPRDPGDPNQWVREEVTFDVPPEMGGRFHVRYWGTLTYDPVERRILFLEGYSNDADQPNSIYSNAVYEWRVDERVVRMLSFVNWTSIGDNGYVPGPGPASDPHPRHPYGAFRYHAGQDAVYMAFGACVRSSNCDVSSTWRYDTALNTWSEATELTAGERFGGFDTCFETVGNNVWAISPRNDSSGWIQIAALDVDSNTWADAVPFRDVDDEEVAGLVDTARHDDESEILIWAWGQLSRFSPTSATTTQRIAGPPDVSLEQSGAIAFGAGVYLFYFPELGETWALDPTDDSWLLVDAFGPADRIDRYLEYDAFNDLFVMFSAEGEFYSLQFDRSML